MGPTPRQPRMARLSRALPLLASVALVGACGRPGSDFHDGRPTARNAKGLEPFASSTAVATAERAALPVGASVEGRFSLKLNSLSGAFRNGDGNAAPTAQGVTVIDLPVDGAPTGTPPLRLHVFAKDAPGRTGILLAEVFVENTLDVPLQDLVLTFGERRGGIVIPLPKDKGVFDWTIDPFVDTTTQAPLVLDRVAPRGMASAWIGVPHQFAGEISFDVRVTGKATSGAPQIARSIAITPDDTEVWSAFADGKALAVVDTASNATVARILLEGQPSSVAITPDGVLVLVAIADTNQVVVIDRATRAVVQTLGEPNGLGRQLDSLVVDPKGMRAYVAGYVSDTVDVLERQGNTFRRVGGVDVGRRPLGLSLSADGETLYVAHFLPRGGIRENEAWTTLVDTRTLATRESRLPDQFNKRNTGCSKLAYDTPFLKLKVGDITSDDVEMEGIFSQMAGVFLTPNGTQAWLPGVRVAGGVQVWETGPNARKDVSGLVTFQPGELGIPIVMLMDTRGKQTLVPQRLNGYERPVGKPYSRCMAFEREFDFTRGDFRKTKPNELVNRLATYPTGMSGLSELGLVRHVEFTKGGRRALMISTISDEIAVQDALTGHPGSVFHMPLSGSNPVSMVLSSDGAKGYVNYMNSPDVSVVDLSAYADPAALPMPSYVPYEFKHVDDVPDIIGVTGRPNEKWVVRDVKDLVRTPPIREATIVRTGLADPLTPEMRRGKTLFNSSNPDKYPISVSRAGACASCHPGGHTDGSAWSTMEGERRTMSLRGGVAGRGWLHISGTHTDALEFVDTVVTERLGGRLDKADEKALASFIAFGIPKLQGPKVDAAAAARGQAIFKNSCAGCHSDAQGGSGNADLADPFGGAGKNGPKLFDIGSAKDKSFVTLGPVFERLFPEPEAKLLASIRGDRALGGSDYAQSVLDFRPRPERAKGAFKAPSLVNVWDHAVWFHHGHVGSLEESVEEIAARIGMELTREERDDLVAYLKTL